MVARPPLNVAFVLVLSLHLLLTGCSGEVSYQPPGTPIVITLDSSGHIGVHAEARWATPVGIFGLEAGATTKAQKEAQKNNINMIIIKHKKYGQAVYSIYPLPLWKRMTVKLDGHNTLTIKDKVFIINATQGKIKKIVISEPPDDGPTTEADAYSDLLTSPIEIPIIGPKSPYQLMVIDPLVASSHGDWDVSANNHICYFGEDGYHVVGYRESARSQTCTHKRQSYSGGIDASIDVRITDPTENCDYTDCHRSSPGFGLVFSGSTYFRAYLDGTWELHTRSFDKITPIVRRALEVTVKKSGLNKLRVRTEGTRLQLFVNEKRIYSETAKDDYSGFTGVECWDGECIFSGFVIKWFNS